MKLWERIVISKNKEINRLAEISKKENQKTILTQNPLTPEQILNWREALCISLGPYALIMSDSDVQKMRDSLQEKANKL